MTQVAGALAALLGYITRAVVAIAKATPGLAGPALVVIGVAQYDVRAALILAGILLTLLDRWIK